MQTLFTVFLIAGIVAFGINLILKIIGTVKNKETKDDIFDITMKSLFNKFSIVAFSAAIAIYGLFSFAPYIANENDRYLIESYTMNIKMYETYISDYQASAQKQIDDYQSAQAAMARTASAIQLQFYSQQIDAVGKGITDKIKEFNDLIMKQKIATNDATARMTIRKFNKFYFY
jgi:predicted PurR-regulated permease PerM